ncbi:lipase [Acrasis kona]|uniref:Carboxylic ester hydrolase n=1 Tax=Acrasis kona TaxID=1008807 RepID=A0AAW2Z6P6_9EUKA
MTEYTSTSSVKHDKLGVVFNGLSTENGYINQFRGIRFGTISKRWEYGKAYQYDANTKVDATKYGPICPQPPTLSEVNLLQIPEAHRQDRASLVADELDCLNLIITAPANKEKLPVMVWIYGGANTTGGNCFKVYDSTHLVNESIVQSSPILVVNINYRVNFFGFSAPIQHEDGFSGNYGLHDQQLALKWIKENIEPFGGDPDQVTIVGESAGSMNAHYQIQSPLSKDLFKRAILMSGTSHSSPPLALQTQKHIFSKLGLPSTEASDLVQLPAQQLIDILIKFPGLVYFNPTDDGKFFGPKWESDAAAEWCESIMIGDCGFESVLWLQVINKKNSNQIKEALNQDGLDADFKQNVLREYPGLDSSGDEGARKSALDYVNDVLFAANVDRVCSDFVKKEKSVHRFLFDQGNPFEGPLKNIPHHAVDVLYLFANTPLITHQQKEISKEFQSKVLKFVNGGEPFGKVPEVMYGFGPNDHYGLVSSTEYRMRRRHKGFKVILDANIDQARKIATHLIMNQ